MPPIWFDKQLSLDKIKYSGCRAMAEYIGIEWVEVGDNFLKAKMPVDSRTKQPYGILHGGASCVLAETIGSVASTFVIDCSKFICVGLEINANHIHPARDGYVIGIATPIHIGISTHVWDIKIYDESAMLVCVSRLTVAILKKDQHRLQNTVNTL
jgi:1,4-dihydroxy-2-naphthoyl-CoA hydrolase